MNSEKVLFTSPALLSSTGPYFFGGIVAGAVQAPFLKRERFDECGAVCHEGAGEAPDILSWGLRKAFTRRWRERANDGG